MRSRTGCLTCRNRKLKCDEQKPVCSQCRKAGRECRPSEGIIFRHQQNASMNQDLSGPSDGRGNLKGFYSYKNTFDKDSVWLDIPKHIIFVNNSDPYAEDIEAALGESEAAILAANSHNPGWNTPQVPSGENEVHGLDALSTAAAHDRFSYTPLGFDRQSISTADSASPFNHIPASVSGLSPNQLPRPIPSQTPSSISITPDNGSNNNINFLLNPSQSLSPPVDPTIQRTPDCGGSSLTPRSTEAQLEVPAETDHEVSFLLRHFSEVPGLWMDLYDLGTYFASYVPVRALRNPLLKYAACAYAAKQLGHVKVAKLVGGIWLKEAIPEMRQENSKIDWCWNGAKYYEKAIQLLMKELQPDGGPQQPSSPEPFGQRQVGDLGEESDAALKRTRSYTEKRLSNGAHSDEILAATAILSVYEFLDATGPAWNRHLSGVKSLLDLAEVGMRPLQPRLPPGNLSLQPLKRPRPSKARRATFWNFARQDYLAAFINESQTRLNTDDLALWTDAGLKIDSMGFIRATNISTAGYPEGEDVMKEDLIANGLVWILSKIVNFIGSADNGQLHSGTVTSSTLGLPQQAPLERWCRLETELEVWYNGRPDTFRPCARIGRPHTANSIHLEGDDSSSLSEIWYSLPMCSSAMQHYHMARILLLINKPHESTSRGATITNRLNSYRSIESDIRFHSREIVGIAMACPEGSVRINSLQPLFVSGQCLTEPSERRMVLRLLREIETDLGWATEYRVQQLLKEWGWDENPDTIGVL